jgi:uncharacterized protein (TIGR03437 family)
MLKFYLLIAAFAATVWGQFNCGDTLSACLNSSPSREFGQPALLPSLNSVAPNLVEGRELFQPFAVAFDTSVTPNILYIVDTGNSRVLGYQNPSNLTPCGAGSSLPCGKADVVIGPRPGDFTTTLPGGPNAISPAVSTGFSGPTSAAVDASGNLYVLDAGNNRILRFPAPFKQNGALWLTDLVIGQRTIVSGAQPNQGQPTPTASSLYFSNGSLLSCGLAIEPATGALWVTDPGNNRVLRFPASQLAANTSLPQADLVIGQTNFTTQQVPTPPPNTQAQLVNTSTYQPGGIAFDASDRLYVSDGQSGFFRVLFFNGGYSTGMAATRLLGLVFQLPSPAPLVTFPNQYALANPVGLTTVGNHLWVADAGQSRVVEYDVPENWPAPPTTAPGQPPTTAQISPPMIAVIGQNSLTVATTGLVCPVSSCPNKGQARPGNGTVYSPFGIASNGTDLWVADTFNNRVLDFPQSGGTYSTASRLAGQVDFPYNSANLIEGREVNFPRTASVANLPLAGGGIAIDHNSNPPHLYIADTANNRILCFNSAFGSPTHADLVLGQTDFYSSLFNSPLNDPGTMTPGGLNLPTDVAVDANGNLWVADAGNGRVLRFPAPFSQPAGTQIMPTVVLGQLGFAGTPIRDASIETMAAPFGLAIFSTGALAVSDLSLNRILIFKVAPGGDFQNSQSASIVLGQGDFNSNTPSNSSAGLYSPRHIAVDTSDRLYVADGANNRLVVFNGAANLSNGSGSALQLPFFNGPQGVKVSRLSGEVWLTDTNGQRVYRLPEYDTLIIKSTPTSFPTTGQLATQTQPIAVELDNSDNLLVSELANRVTFFYPALAWQNAANFNSQPLSPGQLALLYRWGAGYNFSSLAASPPLQSSLGDVQVLVNGVPAPIYFLAGGAISFQVPSSAPISGTASFVVQHASTGEILGASSVPMAPFNPGFFADGANGISGIGLAASNNWINGSFSGINGPSNAIPANNTNFISFYLTGGGPFPGVPDGQIPALTVPTSIRPQILSVDGWAGLVPDDQITYSGSSFFPGVWQINFLVSNKYAPGTHIIAVTMNGTASNVGPSGTIQVYFVSK